MHSVIKQVLIKANINPADLVGYRLRNGHHEVSLHRVPGWHTTSSLLKQPVAKHEGFESTALAHKRLTDFWRSVGW